MKLHVSAIRRAILPVCLLAVTGLAFQAGSAQGAPTQTQTAQAVAVRAATSAALQLHVSGNKLVNANHATVVLHGVDRSGTEYMCVLHNGIFDGPSDAASIKAMKTWDINAVRVTLNEACWNGENYVKSAYAGSNYRSAIEAYVKLLNANGLVAG